MCPAGHTNTSAKTASMQNYVRSICRMQAYHYIGIIGIPQ